jgi:putative ABC transport system substrate-binding protein
MGISVQTVGVREPDDFEAAFEVMNDDMPDAILLVTDSLTNHNRKRRRIDCRLSTNLTLLPATAA